MKELNRYKQTAFIAFHIYKGLIKVFKIALAIKKNE